MNEIERHLEAFAASVLPAEVLEIVPNRVFYAKGFGHSNATFVLTDDSVVVIDTLDSRGRGERLRQLIRERTDLPITTVIYTHGHPDHRGGAGAFEIDDPKFIAFAPVQPLLARSDRIQGVLAARGARQFGYDLPDDEMITQGLGPREGHVLGDPYAFVTPTTVIESNRLGLTIGGIEFVLQRAPGETDDTGFVWLPQFGVVCPGDNFYPCWPNLYAIRGGQYRNVASWVDSLDEIIALNAKALLPGHFNPIVGPDEIRKRLTDYRDALDWLLNATLDLIEKGVTIDDLAAELDVPQVISDNPDLHEFYGTIEWSAKAIFTAYVGWFNGNPTHLHPLPTSERAERLVTAMGGADKMLAMAASALDDGDAQWAMELCDYLLAINHDSGKTRAIKAKAMRLAARTESSACSRNYFISCARELERDL